MKQQIIVGTREFFAAYADKDETYTIVGGYGNGVYVWVNTVPPQF